ncbi:MAG TPA: L,D-transpeptidase family protein [Capsulimonadaceae bacterium]|jgi:murein L,D-transpeptidase YafK
MRLTTLWSLALVALLLTAGCSPFDDQLPAPIHRLWNPTWRSVSERQQEYGTAARSRVAASFERAGVAYPPSRIVLLALKRERVLEVYAANPGAPMRYIRTYSVKAASGHLGPKLREGDRQVPEGVYDCEELNANSDYHLSLRVGYPNDIDWDHAVADGRTEPGQDIMIHGNAKSVGCLAMGDQAAEDLFILAADTGREHVKIVIAPVDFRRGERVAPEALAKMPPWTPTLYATIKAAMAELPKP